MNQSTTIVRFGEKEANDLVNEFQLSYPDALVTIRDEFAEERAEAILSQQETKSTFAYNAEDDRVDGVHYPTAMVVEVVGVNEQDVLEIVDLLDSEDWDA
jgi:hypothetical protein